MNLGQVNGFGLNSSAVNGNNATLTGGLITAAVFSASLVANVILSGGIETAAESGGRVSRSLDGGTYSVSDAGGVLFKTANLQQGITSLGSVGSNLGIADALTGGVYSVQDLGGQRIANAKLQMADTVGDTNTVGAGLTYSSGLTGGFESTSYVSGFLKGSVVLMADGLKSDSELGGKLDNGFTMSGGAESSSDLEGTLHYPAILSDGIQTTSFIDQGLSISPRLQDGIVQVGELGSPGMRINAELDEGIASHQLFIAQIIISPNSNYGVDTNSEVGGLQRIGARLSGGINSTSYVDGVQLKAAQRLQGGINSISGFVSGSRVIGSALNNGIASDALTVGQLKTNPKLQSGFTTDSVVDGSQRLTARLQGGAESSNAGGGQIKAVSVFQGGFGADELLGGQLMVQPALRDGIANDSTTGGDIVRGFRDPLLNTWALDIRSVTPLLEIATPTSDI